MIYHFTYKGWEYWAETLIEPDESFTFHRAMRDGLDVLIDYHCRQRRMTIESFQKLVDMKFPTRSDAGIISPLTSCNIEKLWSDWISSD